MQQRIGEGIEKKMFQKSALRVGDEHKYEFLRKGVLCGASLIYQLFSSQRKPTLFSVPAVESKKIIKNVSSLGMQRTHSPWSITADNTRLA